MAKRRQLGLPIEHGFSIDGKQKVSGDKPWGTVTLKDFAELRKAGLTHPLMDEIEKAFSARG
jgi:hypothetical protein